MRNFFIVLIIIFLWFYSSPVYAGTSLEIDSLEQTLKRVEGLQKINNLIRLTQIYWQISAKKSMEYGRKAYSLSKRYSNNKTATEALLYIAVAKLYIGEYDSCIYYSKTAIATGPKERKTATLGFGYNLISLSYKSLGNFEKALYYGKKAYKIRSNTTDTVNIAGSLDNIAHIYEKIGKYEKSLKYSLKSLVLFQKMKDTLESAKTLAGIANLYFDLDKLNFSLQYCLKAKALLYHHKNTLTYADVHSNIGNIYLIKKQYDTALPYFVTSLKVYKMMDIKSGIAEEYQNIGLCYSNKKQYKQALLFLHKSYDICTTTGSKLNLLSNLQSFGIVFMQSNRLDSAKAYFLKSYQLALAINNPVEVKESLKNLSDLYEKTGNCKSLFYYKAYIHYRDSIEGNTLKLKLAKLQANYKITQKEKKILKLQIAEKTDSVRTQNLIYLMIISSLFFIALLLFFIIKRKNEKIFYKQQNIIAHNNKMLTEAKLKESRLKAIQLEEKLFYKSKQLTSHSLNMMQKTKFLQDIDHSLMEIINAKREEQTKRLNQLKLRLPHMLKADKDWNLFKMYFEEINENFIAALLNLNAGLTENEIRICTLIKLNMNLKEMASVLNISPNSVKNARHRIKKKFQLTSEENLTKFILQLGENHLQR